MRHFFSVFLSAAAISTMIVCPVLADETTTSVDDEKTGIVSQHGQLSVSDEGCVVDEDGDPFQLKGISTHNPVWFPDYFCEETITELVDNFNINVLRLAMYTAENDGYAVANETRREKTNQMIRDCIDTAIDLDIYVVVDWHILSDNDPNTYKSEAIEFFSEISADYSDCPNVLYEICNEPNGGTTWDDIKSYSTDVIDSIRKNSPDSVIIVGTPTWSQDVDLASQSPLDYDNLLYSLHFYAATHGSDLQNKLKTAVDAGLPILVSEFGISEASGNGSIDTKSADEWIKLLDQNNIGYIYWNLSNKDESCALLKSTCTSLSGWTVDDLTPAGQWFYELMNRDSTDETVSVSIGGDASVTEAQTTVAPSPSANASSNVTAAAASGTGASASATLSYAADGSWVFSNNCSVSVTANGCWADDNYQYSSYDVIISNNGSSDISDWRLRLTWNVDITPKEYWSCDIGGSGNSRLFVPVDYNSTIPSGSSVQFGVIVYSDELPTMTGIAFEN